jgi:two-component system NtrC family sensor kinase
MNIGAFERHGVLVEKQFAPVPLVRVDRHKVLQILINLLRNAKYALDESKRTDKRIMISVVAANERSVHIVVADNGVGISPENLTRIFAHGFTTREEGHGFGLHSGALAARAMGGALSVASAGTGRGATFTLELPRASSLIADS